MQEIKIEFQGKRSFDTREEALSFTRTLKERYKACYLVKYSDCKFYIVEFDE